MADTETIIRQFRFTFETEFGVFSDAINYTDDEWQNTSAQQRRQAARARRDAWVNMLKNTSATTPTKKQLREEKQALLLENADRAARLAAVEAAIDSEETPNG